MGMKIALIATAVLTAPAFSATAQAAELVVNGGFETGDFTGWTQGGNTGATYVGTLNSGYFPLVSQPLGDYSAFLGPVGSVGTLTQNLATVVGDVYNVTFVLANEGGTPNSFLATFGANTIVQQANSPTTAFPVGDTTYLAFTTFVNSFTATSTSTPLTFTFRNDPSYWVLDNVSVTGESSAVPEPASWAMMIGGFGLVGGAMRARRRTTARVTYA